MTQSNNNPAVPLTEFVDSVFAELSSHDNKWNPHEEGYGYYDNPDCLKDTLIPLAKRLYELAQVDDKVYWWLLQLMSQVCPIRKAILWADCSCCSGSTTIILPMHTKKSSVLAMAWRKISSLLCTRPNTARISLAYAALPTG